MLVPARRRLDSHLRSASIDLSATRWCAGAQLPEPLTRRSGHANEAGLLLLVLGVIDLLAPYHFEKPVHTLLLFGLMLLLFTGLRARHATVDRERAQHAAKH